MFKIIRKDMLEIIREAVFEIIRKDMFEIIRWPNAVLDSAQLVVWPQRNPKLFSKNNCSY